MLTLFGEYSCKLDEKGRFLVPQALLKQLPEEQRSQFVMNRGLEPCLVLYPEAVWHEELTRIYQQNRYKPEVRTFARLFQSGAQPIQLDGNRRLTVPKSLQGYAQLEHELIVLGQGDRMELWSQATFDSWLAEHEQQRIALSERVMAFTPDKLTTDNPEA